MFSVWLFLLVRLIFHYSHSHAWPWHIHFLVLTYVVRIQVGCLSLLYWYWKGWWLFITHVSLMFLCLGKNICLPQSPTHIWLDLSTEGSCALDPGVLEWLQYWVGGYVLTIFSCLVLANWVSFHYWLPSENFLAWFWSNIHVDIGLAPYLLCLLLWFCGIYLSMALRLVCPIIHLTCFYDISILSWISNNTNFIIIQDGDAVIVTQFL